MADIVPVSDNVRLRGASGNSVIAAVFGEAMEKGDWAYLTANKWWKTDADHASDLKAGSGGNVGMVTTAAGIDEQGVIAKCIAGAKLDPGAAVVNAKVYCLSSTAARICPIEDLSVGERLFIVGVGEGTTAVRGVGTYAGVTA